MVKSHKLMYGSFFIVQFIIITLVIVYIKYSVKQKMINYDYVIDYRQTISPITGKRQLYTDKIDTILNYFTTVRYNIRARPVYTFIVYNIDKLCFEQYKLYYEKMLKENENDETRIKDYIQFIRNVNDHVYNQNEYYNINLEQWQTERPNAPVWDKTKGIITFRESTIISCPMYSNQLKIQFKIEDGILKNANTYLFPTGGDVTRVPFTFERYYYTKMKQICNFGNIKNNMYYFELQQDNDNDSNDNWVFKTCPENTLFDETVFECLPNENLGKTPLFDNDNYRYDVAIKEIDPNFKHIENYKFEEYKFIDSYETEQTFHYLLGVFKILIHVINGYAASSHFIYFLPEHGIFKQIVSGPFEKYQYIANLENGKSAYKSDGTIYTSSIPFVIYQDKIKYSTMECETIWDVYNNFDKDLFIFNDEIKFPFINMCYINDNNKYHFFSFFGNILMEYVKVSNSISSSSSSDSGGGGDGDGGDTEDDVDAKNIVGKLFKETDLKTRFTINDNYAHLLENYKSRTQPLYDFDFVPLPFFADKVYKKLNLVGKLEQYIPVFGFYDF